MKERMDNEEKTLKRVMKKIYAWLIPAKHGLQNLPFEKRLLVSSNAIHKSPEKKILARTAPFKKMKIYRGSSI